MQPSLVALKSNPNAARLVEILPSRALRSFPRRVRSAILEALSAEEPQVAVIWRAHEGDIEVPLVVMDDDKRALPFFEDLEHASEFMEASEEYNESHGWAAAMVGADGLITIADVKGVEWAGLIGEPDDYSSVLLGSVHRWAEIMRNPEA